MKKIRTTELTSFCKMVGANLRKMRTAKRLSQAEVGRAIGIRFQQIQKYEGGSNCLSSWRLKQLANFFKVSTENILDPQYIAKFCNNKEDKTIKIIHEQWAIKNGYRDNDTLNIKNTLGFENGAKR